MKEKIEAMLARLTEAGRVLSGKNEKALRAAVEALNKILALIDKSEGEAVKESFVLLESMSSATDGSIEQYLDRIRTAVYAKYRPVGFVQEGSSVWVFATFPNFVIVEKGTKYLKVPYMDDGKDITFGKETEVTLKQSFEEITESLALLTEKLLESQVGEFQESVALSEEVEILESVDDAGFKWRVRLIKAGKSGNKRQYPESTLEDAVPLFEGAKAYDGHMLRRGSAVKDLVGIYEDVAVEERGGIKGVYATLNILESAKWLRDMVVSLKKLGKLDAIGVSIDALGKTRITRTTEGLVALVEKIHKVNSVDIVADPAAGGAFERLIASEGGEELNKLAQLLEMLSLGKTLEQIKEAHPDFFDADGKLLIEGVRVTESGVTPIDGSGVSAADVAELREAIKKSDCRTVLTVKLSEANLPPIMKDKLKLRFEDRVFEAEELDGAIAESQDIYAAFRGPQSGLRGFGQTDVSVTEEEADKKQKALDGLFEGASVDGVAPFRSFKRAFMEITGLTEASFGGSEDFNRKILESCVCVDAHVDGPGAGSVKQLIRESLDTTSFPNVLANSLTKRLMKEYGAPDLSSWRKVVSDISSVTDFRTQERTRFGGYGLLPVVGEKGVYQPLTSPTDEKATGSLAKRGGTEDLTLEMIANDDVGAIRRIPRALGRAAGVTLYRAVFDMLKDNETCTYDSTALFHANHGNLGSAALAHASLGTVRQVFREVKGFGSIEELMLNLFQVFVPAELEELAYELTQARKKSTGEDSTLNNINDGVGYTVVPYWADATDWVATANPADIEMIEVGFYQGREEPELFIQDNPAVGSVFTADKITYKIRHIWMKMIKDHRGLYKNVVA